jgi:hypothetical protein
MGGMARRRCVVVSQGRHIVVGAFLIGCAILLVVGCAGTRSETSKKEQGSSPQATDSEEARCEGTQTIKVIPEPRSDTFSYGKRVDFTTYDLAVCPKGGLLSGTDKPDKLAGRDSDDEIRGLGANDYLIGGLGNDVIYGGPGSDRLADWPLAGWWGGGECGGALPFEQRICREVSAKAGGDDVLYGGDGNDELASEKGEDVLYGGDGDDELVSEKGEDVLYGGDGNDFLHDFHDEVSEQERDKLYCGEGEDYYKADKNDYVDSSCEKKGFPRTGAA